MTNQSNTGNTKWDLLYLEKNIKLLTGYIHIRFLQAVYYNLAILQVHKSWHRLANQAGAEVILYRTTCIMYIP